MNRNSNSGDVNAVSRTSSAYAHFRRTETTSNICTVEILSANTGTRARMIVRSTSRRFFGHNPIIGDYGSDLVCRKGERKVRSNMKDIISSDDWSDDDALLRILF